MALSHITVVRPRVLIADDHNIVAEGLRSILSKTCDVIGIVQNGRDLVIEVSKLLPDIIVLDVGMPLLNGLDAARQIKTTLPGMRFVFLTMQDDPNLAAAALELGCIGYVLKHSASSELLTAVSAVMEGKCFVTSRLRAETHVEQTSRARQFSADLTLRQKEVLQLLAEGRPMKEIAEILRISEKTVMFHKYHIMRTFNLKNNADLVLFALKQHLISS
jgi:DNA-binding NarL/FixJ family response regulator